MQNIHHEVLLFDVFLDHGTRAVVCEAIAISSGEQALKGLRRCAALVGFPSSASVTGLRDVSRDSSQAAGQAVSDFRSPVRKTKTTIGVPEAQVDHVGGSPALWAHCTAVFFASTRSTD